MDEQTSHGGSEGSGNRPSGSEPARGLAGQTVDQARSLAGSLTEQARSVASAAGGAVYDQSSQAGRYLTRSIDEYPIAALLVAGAVGYGLAYLVHSGWEGRSERPRKDRKADSRR